MKTFTLDQLKSDRAKVVAAAKCKNGCVVVDANGRKLFSLWIPSGPLE